MPDEAVPHEFRPEMWLTIREFARDLQQDLDLARRFEAEPAVVLGERSLDVSLPEQSGYRSLGELMTRMDAEARLATVESLGNLADHMATMADAPPEPQAALALVNVFAIANANANNNVNAVNSANEAGNANQTVNTNQHSNTSGASLSEAGAVLTQRVITFDEFPSSPAAQHLSNLRLTPARQLTLVKRIALDDDSLVETRRVGDAEFRLSRYAYRGEILEVESLVTRQEIQILSVRLV